MCDKHLLTQIDRRLRRILKCDKKFGGLHVIFSGDFYQLPPVNKNSALYVHNLNKGLKGASESLEAITLMKSITRYNGLDEIERTSNFFYASALKILRLGPPEDLTQEECDRVAKQFAHTNAAPTNFAEALALLNTRFNPVFSSAIEALNNVIAAKWKTVNKYNDEGSALNRATHGTITIYGQHFLKSGSEKVLRKSGNNFTPQTALKLLKYTKSSEGRECVPGSLKLAINDRILITTKISQELGLVNGAKGNSRLSVFHFM